MTKFQDGDSLGSLPAAEIASYLMDIGDPDEAKLFNDFSVSGQGMSMPERSWHYRGFILGYIPETMATSSQKIEIKGISHAPADVNLIGKRIKISLDKFYTDNYPGFGTHNILCEFKGKNQAVAETEELTFALRFESNDKSSAAISGAPIFLGVTVGQDGISFEGRTINVSSDLDDTILTTLDSPAFKSGLSLITTAQPALKPFASLATAVVSNTLKRKKNKQVHNFNIGLDFGSNASSARLSLGTYIVVQKDDASGWDWNHYEWNTNTHSIEAKAVSAEAAVDFNYMVFGVTKFSDADT